MNFDPQMLNQLTPWESHWSHPVPLEPANERDAKRCPKWVKVFIVPGGVLGTQSFWEDEPNRKKKPVW